MNILGVGPAEVIVIFILMLVVAGPKRMIEWAYHIGRYTAQLRAMFQETMNAIQKELSESGLDVSKDLAPVTKSFDIVSEAAKVINSEVSSATSSISSMPTPTATSTPTPTPSESATAITGDNGTPPATAPTTGADVKPDDQKPPEKPRYDSWTPN
jgi:Sec-independent protein translocase protein TatA